MVRSRPLAQRGQRTPCDTDGNRSLSWGEFRSFGNAMDFHVHRNGAVRPWSDEELMKVFREANRLEEDGEGEELDDPVVCAIACYQAGMYHLKKERLDYKVEDEVSMSVEQIFALIDDDHNGVLTREEVVDAAYKLEMTSEEAGLLFDVLDRDGSGTLTQDEFESR